MKNIMKIDGYDVVINYEPEIDIFRGGEFINLNGGADFYAADVQGLQKEGKASLDLFLKICAEDGVIYKNQRNGVNLPLEQSIFPMNSPLFTKKINQQRA